jgi:prefoldin subunit 5
MSNDIAEQLERLITVNERIADSLETMQSTLDSVASDISSIQADALTTDSYAHSAKLDLESIVSIVRGIQIAMP